MSKYHGDQSWTEIHSQTIREWRDLNDDDFDTLRAMRFEREVRMRDQRQRARHYRQTESRDIEV
jgi:hypothetical protein